MRPDTRCTAFHGHRRVAAGELRHVALSAQEASRRDPATPVLIFDDRDGGLIDLALEGDAAALLRRLAALAEVAGGAGDRDGANGGAVTSESTEAAGIPPTADTRRGPGRPKLGVVAREVTLLPRHWAWLASQPGGASVALRRLVDEARRHHAERDVRRQAQDAAYRFMHAIAGDAPGFEEAARALFAAQASAFEEQIAGWPEDVREHAALLAAGAFHE